MAQSLETIHQLHLSNHPLGSATARIVGCATLPLAAVGDVFVHISMTAEKTVTGLIACPWNIIVIISNQKEWQIPENLQLPFALIHLIKAAYIVSTIAGFSILYLITPDRAYQHILAKKIKQKELKDQENQAMQQKQEQIQQLKKQEKLIQELKEAQSKRDLPALNTDHSSEKITHSLSILLPLSLASPPPPLPSVPIIQQKSHMSRLPRSLSDPVIKKSC